MNEIRAAQEELNRGFSEAGQSFYAQNQGAERRRRAADGRRVASRRRPGSCR